MQLVPKGSPDTSASHSEGPGGPSGPECVDWLRQSSSTAVEIKQYYHCYGVGGNWESWGDASGRQLGVTTLVVCLLQLAGQILDQHEGRGPPSARSHECGGSAASKLTQAERERDLSKGQEARVDGEQGGEKPIKGFPQEMRCCSQAPWC